MAHLVTQKAVVWDRDALFIENLLCGRLLSIVIIHAISFNYCHITTGRNLISIATRTRVGI